MRTLIVEADGASRGNPGEASYGAVVKDEGAGELRAELAAYLGRATDNMAEYRGLIAGLEAAAAIDPAARVSPTPPAASLESAAPVESAAPAESAAPKESAKSRVAWSPDLGRPSRLLLLRHGVTPLTLEKRFAGIGDPPLTEQGREQARRAAERLAAEGRYGALDAIVSSPLQRTLATAQAVADAVGLPVEPEPGVREIDFGRLEGLTFAEAHERYPDELSAFLGSPEVPPPGGETLAALARRAIAAKDRLLRAHPRQTVLVVTHVTPIKALVCEALGAPLSAVNRMELAAASLSVIDYYDDGLCNVRCVNDTAHLD
jgi:probable phosphoglycerate mutase